MARDVKRVPEQGPEERKDDRAAEPEARTCGECGVKLSAYNPGPNCWQHTIGNPWRGPSAKPRYD